eukprot:1372460-Amorphochlora_amoeboformis.AAC.1
MAAISEEEVKLYDRQIRIWGMEAQRRMRNSRVCIVALQGTAVETIKNLVLAGVGELVILDEEKTTTRDLETNYFLTAADIGRGRAKASAIQIRDLNPNVKVTTDVTPVMHNENVTILFGDRGWMFRRRMGRSSQGSMSSCVAIVPI